MRGYLLIHVLLVLLLLFAPATARAQELPVQNAAVPAYVPLRQTTELAAGSQVNSLAMPNAAASVSVTYETCYALNFSVSGSGDPLSVAPPTSYGCLSGGFAAGQSIMLLANPSPGWAVAGWNGTNDDGSTAVSSSWLLRTVYPDQLRV